MCQWGWQVQVPESSGGFGKVPVHGQGSEKFRRVPEISAGPGHVQRAGCERLVGW